MAADVDPRNPGVEMWSVSYTHLMNATRLGEPEKAVEALLMNKRTNTYLPNGHNYQDPRLRVYLRCV